MRYEVRHNNRIWHVFDTWAYSATAAYPLESHACAHVDGLNLPTGRRPASLLG